MTGETFLRKQETQVKQPEVTAQIDRLHAVGKMLDENLAMLEERLKPVLAERKSEAGSAGNSPEPVRVPLAQELYSVEQGFRRFVDRVNSMSERLEI